MQWRAVTPVTVVCFHWPFVPFVVQRSLRSHGPVTLVTRLFLSRMCVLVVALVSLILYSVVRQFLCKSVTLRNILLIAFCERGVNEMGKHRKKSHSSHSSQSIRKKSKKKAKKISCYFLQGLHQIFQAAKLWMNFKFDAENARGYGWWIARAIRSILVTVSIVLWRRISSTFNLFSSISLLVLLASALASAKPVWLNFGQHSCQ